MKAKPNYWYNQSAVIPFRYNNNKIELLIISTRKNKKWIFPKGIIEENLTEREAAEKEALEEAGITGKLLPESVGEYKYKKWGGKCKVKVFAMRVAKILDVWDEDFRKRKWVDLSNIDNYINDSKLKKIYENFLRNANENSF